MGDVPNRGPQRHDRSRGAPIGRDAKAIRLLLLKDVRHLAQLAGYRLIEGIGHCCSLLIRSAIARLPVAST
jgi:hypothetical protein